MPYHAPRPTHPRPARRKTAARCLAAVERKKLFAALAFMIRGKMAVCSGDEKGAEVTVRIGKTLQQQVMP